MTTDVAQVLDLYQQLNRRSVTKWNAFGNAVGNDRRLRGAHQFRGASRTGRDAHRLVQPGNMPRGNIKDPVAFADMMLLLGHWGVSQFATKSVMDALSSLIRTAITAPEGYTFVISDLSSVESRKVGWLSGCQAMHRIFASGQDTYKVFATWYFNKGYDDVTKKERGFCKPPVLGCFSGETQVLTESGWKPIVEVLRTDRVWDGVEWVSHGGVVLQGTKTVQQFFGVWATPDHEIMLEGETWASWGALVDGDPDDGGRANWVSALFASETPGEYGTLHITEAETPGAVEERLTYDILNSGPRQRYTIATSRGTMIAHNCAYMLSGGSYDEDGEPKGGLIKYAADMGVELLKDQADHMVRLFRERFFEIVEMWTWLDQAAKYVIQMGHGAKQEGYRVMLEMDREFLFIHLPSGRRLSYLRPEVRMVAAPWDRTKRIENVTYMGYNQHTKGKWTRIHTHPGKWVEQITQGSSYDLFFHGLDLYEQGKEFGDDYGAVLRVHDEIVAVVPEDRAETELARLEHCMSVRPPWADDKLLLGAEGFISKRYRKD